MARLLPLALLGFPWFAEGSGLEMTALPPGSFVMGDGEAVCGRVERPVTLTRAFWIARHEVTNGEYVEALQWAYDHGCVTADSSQVRDALDGSVAVLLDLAHEACEIQFDGAGSFFLRQSPSADAQAAYPEGYDPAQHPVKKCSWFGAAAFCDWLSLREDLPRAYHHGSWLCHGGDPYGASGYRLPTDAEWEYAARFDDERSFPWGEEPPDCGRANFYLHPQPCVGWTVPAGTYPEAPSMLQLANLAGNMWEWCNDWFVCDLPTQPAVDPAGPSLGAGRVVRAGGWASVDYDLRCAMRAYAPPSVMTASHGLRVARSIHDLSGVRDTSAGEDSGVPGAVRSATHLWAHPNPFRVQTAIHFSLPVAGPAELRIHTVDGRLIRRLCQAPAAAGSRVCVWDGCDDSGRRVPAGTYQIRLAGHGVTTVVRAIVLR